MAGQADGTTDPKTPIPGVEKSSFDSQQLIEQTILDLTQNDNLLLDRCNECDKVQHTHHSREGCFEKVAKKEFTEVELGAMEYPMFREVQHGTEDPEGTEEKACSVCLCPIRTSA